MNIILKALRLVRIADCSNYLSNGSEKQHYLNIKLRISSKYQGNSNHLSEGYSELLVLEPARDRVPVAKQSPFRGPISLHSVKASDEVKINSKENLKNGLRAKAEAIQN